MRAQRLTVILLFIALRCMSPLSYAAYSQTASQVTPEQLSAAIAELQSGKHEVVADASKEDAGLHLAHLIRRTKPNQVDDRTVAEIESLLASSDDYIRFWAATSLGELGPRAKIAVPELLKLLPVVDCINGPITSATAIRLALKRIGATPPPVPACPGRISGD
jgi:hypothetical protein